MARAKEHRGGIEREVYREEEREYARDFEREEHRQNLARAEQRVHREQLHADGDDERLAYFLGHHLVATVHGVHAERSTERKSDIQCDGWQEQDCPDDGRDNHTSQNLEKREPPFQEAPVFSLSRNGDLQNTIFHHANRHNKSYRNC